MPDGVTEKHERLAFARVKAGYRTQKEAAAAMGINPATLSSHESGRRNFREDDAELYARAFNVDWAWLMTGRQETGPSKTRDVKVIAWHNVLTYLGGKGGIDWDDVLRLPLETPKDAFAVRMQDNSMQGESDASLFPGDWVLVNPTALPLSGRQALVHMQSIDENAIRTLQAGPVKKGKRTYTLHALNAMYPPEPLNGSIVGIVVGVFRLHPFATL